MPLVILLAYSLYSAVNNETQQARAGSVARAQAAADDIQHFLENAQTRLYHFAERSEIRTALKDAPACSHALQTLEYAFPEASFSLIVDAQGNPLCAAPALDWSNSFLTTRAWFSDALAGKSFVLTPQDSPLPDHKSFLLTMPLVSSTDTTRGLVLVGIDSAQLQALLMRQRPSEQTIFALADDKGMLLASAPESTPAADWQTAVNETRGNVQARGLDGIERIFGIAAIPQTGWRVAAGMPTGFAFASAWQYALVNGILLLATILIAAIAAHVYTKRIERPINALVEATSAVTQGDLTTRVSVQGPSELTQLATQFNTMVDAREAFDKALRIANEKYRTLIEEVPAVVYRLAPGKENRVVFVNAEIQDLLGYSPQEWIHTRGLWAERIHPDDRARVVETLAQVNGANSGVSLEYRIYARDDKLVWVRDRVRALPQHNGQPRLLQGIVFDISARKAAAERMAYQARLLDQVHDAIIATDAAQHVTTWNRAAEEMYGWTAGEASGRTLDEIISAEMPAQEQLAFMENLETQGAARTQVQHFRKTGEPIFVESTTMAVRDYADEITGYVSVNRDVSEHKRAAQALEQRTAHAEALAHTAAAMNARLELKAVVGAVVSETALALQVPVALLFLYNEASNTFHLAAASGLGEECVTRLQAMPYIYPIAFDSPPSLYSRNWSSLAMWSNAGRDDMPALTGALTVPIRHEQDWIGLLCAATTTTARSFSGEEGQLLTGLADQAALAIANARLFEQVRAGRQRLQTLSRRLVEVQETERHAIARELHDEIGQSLTGLSLVLEMTARTAPNGANENLAEAQSIVNQIMKQVRNLSLELRPAMLDDLGLVPALTWQIQRYSTQTGIQVDMKLMGLEGNRFPPPVETAAYRIVQEALTNVARYAHVSQAKVRVWKEEQALGLMVEDEGTGFEADAAITSNQSSGLIGMRERTTLLGGQFVLESAPGQGTRVNARLPLRSHIERRERTRAV